MAASPNAHGRPTPRLDGPAKVTGRADYTADVVPAGLAYGAIVQAGIGRGRLQAIETRAAAALPGVLGVWTHENRPKLHKATPFPMGAAWQERPPLEDDQVAYSGQVIALVVADTLETARAAAALVQPVYADMQPAAGHLDAGPAERIAKLGMMGKLLSEDASRGDVEAAQAKAPVRLNAHYDTPRHLQMPMEPHATVAWWDNPATLTVREGTQWVDGAQDVIATWFGLKRAQVRLLSAYVGGGFGLRVGVLPHAALAILAARELRRPVKLVLDRHEVCLLAGTRPATRHHVQLAAAADGQLLALSHDTTNETSRAQLFNEPGSRASKSTYAVPNYRARHAVVQLDIAPPTWMRAPGETPGNFALECALDELAAATGRDPLALRLRNYADKEPQSGKAWSSNHLRAAYAAGAEAFGWANRPLAPRQRREGALLIGTGMATAAYSAKQAPSEARLRLHADGHVTLESRGVDIGTGAYTAMALVISEALGLGLDAVEVQLGNTDFARSAFAGGSMMTASLGAAVHGAARQLKDELLDLAGKLAGSPFHGKARQALWTADGRVHVANGTGSLAFADVLAAAGKPELVAEYRTHPSLPSRVLGAKAFTSMAAIAGPTSGETAVHSWGAQFAEVAVDEELGTIRVRRLVGAFDCGRVVNPTTARSQLLGGMVMGLGMALSEGAHIDARLARVMNANLGEYLVPVQADIPPIEVLFVGEFDPAGGPLGGKAVGELGITGVAAAIANAVYHATGQRLRTLPLDLRG